MPSCSDAGYVFDRQAQTLTLHGATYTGAEAVRFCTEQASLLPGGQNSAMGLLGRFLGEWFDASPTVPGQTSGSTGEPKRLALDKARMMNSARLTCSFLGLRPGDTALLCMPLKYIGAKMVVVRALVAGLDLIAAEPSSHPLAGMKEAPCFAAMTPMQVISSLESPEEARLLRSIRHLIIGGGAISAPLAAELAGFPHGVWSTYGMTETLSHIALRRLSGPTASAWYEPFEGVGLSLADGGTLVIEAPAVCPETLVTNDIAELAADGRFRIIGRRDNTINSGGIKLQIEVIEELIAPFLDCPFQVTATPDAKLGEAVTLLTEAPLPDGMQAKLHDALPLYHAPRIYLTVGKLPQTGSGKPDRAAARTLAAAAAQERM